MAAQGFCLFDTSIGHCGIAWGERGVAGLLLPEASASQTRARMQKYHPGVEEMPPPPYIRSIAGRVAALLEGVHDDLCDIELDMSGVPPFHQRVYAAARAIAPGRTKTYGDLAQELGDAGAARAVGQALGMNPFAPIVPCHRILAAGARSGGFSAGGGVATKLRMLQIEDARIGTEPGLF